MERSIYTLSIVKLKGLREYIHESSTFPKFFSSSFIPEMEYEDIVDIVCIVRNIETRYIKYYHAIYVLFAQCERHLTQLCKKLYFSDYEK